MLKNNLISISNSETIISNIVVFGGEEKWIEDPEKIFIDFPYKTTILNNKILDRYIVTLFVPDVQENEVKGNLSPYFYTKQGEITIYSRKKILNNFTIETIKLNKGGPEAHWSCLGVDPNIKTQEEDYVSLNKKETILGQKIFEQKVITKEGISSFQFPQQSEPDWNIDNLGNIKTKGGIDTSGSIKAKGNIEALGTIKGKRLYNAVWNDYAEWFEKQNKTDSFEPGDLCSWEKEGIVLTNKKNVKTCVGVYSDSYGIILGGQDKNRMEENLDTFIPIGLMGRVKIKVKGKIKKGDLITASHILGVGKKASILTKSSNIIGKALEDSNNKDIKKITILIK